MAKVEEIFEDQRKKGVPCSGLIIEPIQAEGGDNHASKEFFQVILPGPDAIKKFTPSLGIPYLGVKFGIHLSLLSFGS